VLLRVNRLINRNHNVCLLPRMRFFIRVLRVVAKVHQKPFYVNGDGLSAPLDTDSQACFSESSLQQT